MYGRGNKSGPNSEIFRIFESYTQFFILIVHLYLVFFLLIDIDCDKGFKWYFSGFPLSLMVFKLNLIAVKLVQEQTLFNLLLFYHAAPIIALYVYIIDKK